MENHLTSVYVEVLRVGRVTAEVFEVEEGHPKQTQDNQYRFEYDQLGHLSSRLHRNEIYHNTKSYQQQGHNDSTHQSDPRKWLTDQHPKDEHGQTQFGGVVGEPCEVVSSVFLHQDKQGSSIEAACQ